jgi:hypothetical protein
MEENREYLTSCQAKQQADQTVVEKYSGELSYINDQITIASAEGKYNVKLQNKVITDEVQVYLIEKLGYRLIPGYDPPIRGVGDPIPYVIIDWNTPSCS